MEGSNRLPTQIFATPPSNSCYSFSNDTTKDGFGKGVGGSAGGGKRRGVKEQRYDSNGRRKRAAWKMRFAEHCLKRMKKDRATLMENIRNRSRGTSIAKALHGSLGELVEKELRNFSGDKKNRVGSGVNGGGERTTMEFERKAAVSQHSSTNDMAIHNDLEQPPAAPELTEREIELLLKDLQEAMREDPLYQQCLRYEKEEAEAIEIEVEGYLKDQAKAAEQIEAEVICPFCRKCNWNITNTGRKTSVVSCRCGLKIETPMAKPEVFRKFLAEAIGGHGRTCFKPPTFLGNGSNCFYVATRAEYSGRYSIVVFYVEN
eukprot:jgi/Bigna1/88127/estExt_fgenesh1_pg.C_280128